MQTGYIQGVMPGYIRFFRLHSTLGTEVPDPLHTEPMGTEVPDPAFCPPFFLCRHETGKNSYIKPLELSNLCSYNRTYERDNKRTYNK